MREMVRLNLDGHLPFAADDAPPSTSRRCPPRATAPSTTSSCSACWSPRPSRAWSRRRCASPRRRACDRPRSRWPRTTCWRSPSPSAVSGWCGCITRAPTADILCLFGSSLVLSRSAPAPDEASMGEEIRRSLAVRALAGVRRDLGLRRPAPRRARRSRRCPRRSASAALHRARARPGSRRCPSTTAAPTSWRWGWPLARRVPAARPAAAGACGPAGSRARRVSRSPWPPSTALLLVAALLVPGLREQRHLDRINAEITRLDPQVRAVERRGARARAQAQAARRPSTASRRARSGRCRCCAS